MPTPNNAMALSPPIAENPDVKELLGLMTANKIPGAKDLIAVDVTPRELATFIEVYRQQGTPAACPWKYDQHGRPRPPQQPKRNEPER